MSEADRYVETFRQEAEELLSDIEEIVLALEEDPADQDNINRLFRAMHTIKGSGAMFGFDDVAAFTHHVETTLDKVRAGALGVTKELIDLILASRDQITAMMDAAAGGPAIDIIVSGRIIAGLQALMSGVTDDAKREIQPGGGDESDAPDGRTTLFRIQFHPDRNIFSSGMDPALLLDELRELGECTVVAHADELPALDNMDPETCYLWWSIELVTDRGMDAIRDVFIFVEDTSRIEIEEIAVTDASSKRLGEILVEQGYAKSDDVEKALTQQKPIGELLVESGATSKDKVDWALSQQKSSEKQKATDKNDTLRVPSDKLDTLVNLVGELVINQARLTQIATRIEHGELAMTVEDVERLTGELRDIVLNIRMMPIGTTFGRFKRLVRDLSAELGKEIEMVTEGAETEMDKTVIDRLADPLVHLIRNSIDHGIESPDDRQGSGKSRKGTIRLAAAHMGTNVVITVEDDGKGLDRETIRKKAVERGLVSADEELSDKDIYSLIFLPGFSTASSVTNVSGRGVGMDVVKREIDSLRGTINVNSKKGSGTTIDLSLPLTLAIIDGLLVEVDDERFVIPLALIEECLELTSARFVMGYGRNVIQVRGEPIPFVRLRELFEISGERSGTEETVVVKVGESRVGIVVDHVIGDHQTVIKSLGKAYKDVDGVSGATILGDGSVALILDVPGLVHTATAREEKALLKAG